MSTRFTCPICSAVLNVIDGIPPRTTCPRCLSSLSNPDASRPVAPLRVIPIETEIRRDLGYARHIMIILGVLLIFGGVAVAWSSTTSGLAMIMIVGGILLASVAIIMQIFESGMQRNQPRADWVLPARPGSTLEYQLPQDNEYIPRTPMTLQASAGFVAWIIGVLIVVMAAQSRSSSRTVFNNNFGYLVLGILIALIGLALWLRIQFKWKGFIPGILFGFGLTCLLPIGILIVICAR